LSYIDKSYDFNSTGGSLSDDIRKYYKFREILGGGTFGTVRVGFRKGDESKLFAIKSISKTKLSPEDLVCLEREVEILSCLDHPNIIKFYETYNDQFYFHMIMELCSGKEVIERILEEGQISENRVAQIIYKVTSAINYCHNLGITHRDIKPENILFENKEKDAEIKLIDFGLSKKVLYSNEKMHTILGTPYYVAPEVLGGTYDSKCDIWSIGAITYFMLSGDPPFKGANNAIIFNKILKGKIEFQSNKWSSISEKCKKFILKCLEKDPSKRYSASKALEDEWFKTINNELHNNKKLDNEILENLKNFYKPNKFKKLVLKYLVNNINHTEVKKLKDTFIAMDKDNTGFIEFSELEDSFKMAGINCSKEELINIFKSGENNGKIDYSEFLAGTINQKTFITREKLIKAFKYLDVDGNGEIDTKDLKHVLLRSGKKILNQDELEKTITEFANNKEKITLKEFLNLFGVEEK